MWSPPASHVEAWGAKYDYIVEVLIYNGGQVFLDTATGEELPYVLLPFNQRRWFWIFWSCRVAEPPFTAQPARNPGRLPLRGNSRGRDVPGDSP